MNSLYRLADDTGDIGILDSMGNVIQGDALIENGQPTSLGATYINDSW